jgi:chromosome segregation ATPase
MTALQALLGGGLLGIAALIGSIVSLRGLKNNNAKVVAQTRSIVAEDQDKLLERYRAITKDQDTQLQSCQRRIDDFERREDELEAAVERAEARAAEAERRARNATERAIELVGRVRHLEDVLKRHGLNGN